MSIRRLYYRLPPTLRLLVRKMIYAPIDLIQRDKYKNGLPVPPRALTFTGSGNFKETGLRFVSYFKKHGLQKDHRVLDIGSGIGRMALPLTGFLESTYTGLDIMSIGIEWCKRNITSVYPNFNFIKINAKNDLYSNEGVPATEIHFPVDAGQYDYAILISVFTHLLPAEVEHYLEEIHKALDSGGTCFATFFIFEDEQDLINNNFNPFILQDNHYALMDEKVTSANVAYRSSYLLKIFAEKGFDLVHVSEGRWKSAKGKEDFQDYVVLHKK